MPERGRERAPCRPRSGLPSSFSGQAGVLQRRSAPPDSRCAPAADRAGSAFSPGAAFFSAAACCKTACSIVAFARPHGLIGIQIGLERFLLALQLLLRQGERLLVGLHGHLRFFQHVCRRFQIAFGRDADLDQFGPCGRGRAGPAPDRTAPAPERSGPSTSALRASSTGFCVKPPICACSFTRARASFFASVCALA